MQKNLKIFSSDVFGNLRTWDNNGKIMFVASDVAKMLGYSKPANAIATHCRYALKQGIPHPQGKGTLNEFAKLCAFTKTVYYFSYQTSISYNNR